MASQVSHSIELSGNAGGALLAINSSTEGSPSTIHVVNDATRQHAIFLSLRNNSATTVIVYVFWHPLGSFAASNRMTYQIAPYSEEIVANGERIGDDSTTTAGIGIAAYLDDSGDAGKITARGYAIALDQPLA